MPNSIPNLTFNDPNLELSACRNNAQTTKEGSSNDCISHPLSQIVRLKDSSFKPLPFQHQSSAQAASASKHLHNRNPAFSVTTQNNKLFIQGEAVTVRSGTFQWFRQPQAQWAQMLDYLAASGINTVDMYIPWSELIPEDPFIPNPGSCSSTATENHKKTAVDQQFQKKMIAFMDLVQSKSLALYCRPGPYICNEYDGGGIPGYVRAQATKYQHGSDKELVMRSDDLRWLEYVKHYLTVVNDSIKPFLASNGGPIILYALENEYDYVEKAWLGESTLFQYEGASERPFLSTAPTGKYFNALVNFVQKTVDVPIAHCPGEPKITGHEAVKDLVILPNNYQHQDFCKTTLELFLSAKKTGQPVGYTELPPRNGSYMKSAMLLGSKIVNYFNYTGYYQQGRHNTVIVNPGALGLPFQGMSPMAPKKQSFALDPKRLATLGFALPIGYMPGSMDFYGGVGSAGTLTQKFSNFRRDNLTLETLAPWLSDTVEPGRVTYELTPIPDQNHHTAVNQPLLGCKEGYQHVHYFCKAGSDDNPRGKAYFLQLMNQTQHTQIIDLHSIGADGLTFPQYEPLHIPVENYQGNPTDPEEQQYCQIIPLGLQLQTQARLQYTTANLLVERRWNDEQLLILFGMEGFKGELKLDNLPGKLTPFYKDESIQIVDTSSDHCVITFEYQPNQQFRAALAHGDKLRIIITTQEQAGKIWFFDQEKLNIETHNDSFEDQTSTGNTTNNTAQTSLILTGVQFAHATPEALHMEHPVGTPCLMTTISKQALLLEGFTSISPYDQATGQTQFTKQAAQTSPRSLCIDPQLIQSGFILTLPQPSDSLFHQKKWLHHLGDPVALDTLGIHEGHAWYETDVFLTSSEIKASTALNIEQVSDFAWIYVNGHYIGALAPAGTGIHSQSIDTRYQLPDLRPFLKEGQNTLSVRTEIWGHGAFGCPKGALKLLGAKIPAVSLDSLRGLQGKASLGQKQLKNWRIAAEDLIRSPLDSSKIAEQVQLPLQLKKGHIEIFSCRFGRNDLPKPEEFNAPVGLELLGKSAKASIYLNDELIGRWISDDAWLEQGSWAAPTREMWSFANPDHIPIALSTLKDTNKLQIVFEDTSSAQTNTGRIQSARIAFLEEELMFDCGQTKRTKKPAHKIKTQFSVM